MAEMKKDFTPLCLAVELEVDCNLRSCSVSEFLARFERIASFVAKASGLFGLRAIDRSIAEEASSSRPKFASSVAYILQPRALPGSTCNIWFAAAKAS